MKLRTYTDGGARGNPGPAAIGVLICTADGEIIEEHSETIGEATNNVAEYKALIAGMKKAKLLNAEELDCFMDSLLVVKQLNGEYRLKHVNMQKLYDEVQKMRRQFKAVSYTHVPREEENMRRADQLVNYALDEAKRKVKQ